MALTTPVRSVTLEVTEQGSPFYRVLEARQDEEVEQA